MKHILSACFLLLIIETTHACTCIRESNVKSAFKSTDLVFTGKVISVQEIIEWSDTSYAYLFYKKDSILDNYDKYKLRFFGDNKKLVYTIEITKNYKGKIKTSTIDIRTGFGHGGGDCGFNFDIGKEYLVYAICDYNIHYLHKQFNSKETRKKILEQMFVAELHQLILLKKI
jgi:hypothetical protein